ncbi:protein kinase [Fibrobacterota bacterium]
MNSESQKLAPFPIDPDSIASPILPDVSKNEPLGSGRTTRILGQGGMANVYEIWVPQLEVYRAVKLIKPESSKDAKERFQTEIRILAKLTHPNIIDIHSVGEWKGMPYIEMDKLDGWTLDKILHERGALPPKVCSAIGILVCRALAFAHAHEYVIYGKSYKGIIHRDMKPGNIMICRDGKLILMDFGIARPVDASFHTIEGTVVGTIQYMSPELLKGDKIDFRTDIYGLGATLYEVLVGINPFPEQNFSKLVSLKQKNQYRPLHEFKILTPTKLRKLIHRCMQQDRKKRIDSTDKLLFELEKIHRQLTHELPEITLREFVKEKPAKKVIPRIGIVIPWKPIVAIPLLAFIVGALIFKGIEFLNNYIANLATSKVPPIAQEAPKQETAPPAEITEPDKEEKEDVSVQETKEPIQKKSKKPEVITKAEETKENIPAQTEKEPPEKLPLLSRLSKKYGTADVMTIIEREYSAGHFKTALMLYQHLPSSRANQSRAKIYKMRLLQRLGRSKELTNFLSKNDINDGEFLLAKAKFAYKLGQITKARLLLQNSLNAPKQFIDYTTLKQEVYYYKALCASKSFYRNPTEESYLKALEEWRDVGSLFSSNKNHPLFKEYRKEIQKIGEKYRSTKG